MTSCHDHQPLSSAPWPRSFTITTALSDLEITYLVACSSDPRLRRSRQRGPDTSKVREMRGGSSSSSTLEAVSFPCQVAVTLQSDRLYDGGFSKRNKGRAQRENKLNCTHSCSATKPSFWRPDAWFPTAESRDRSRLTSNDIHGGQTVCGAESPPLFFSSPYRSPSQHSSERT